MTNDFAPDRPGSRRLIAISLLFTGLFSLGLAATTYRTIRAYQTPGNFDSGREGLCDFHNGLYFPIRGLIDGVSPYGQTYAASYPVSRSIPFYLPSVLVLHAPFTIPPLPVADVVYYVFSVGVLLAIAAFLAWVLGERRNSNEGFRLDWMMTIATLLVFSRGGHISLYNGYFTLELVLGTLVAIHFGDRRPWVSSFALMWVAAKPTYILPLGCLLLARGERRCLVGGAVLAILMSVIPMGWLAYHGGGGDWTAGWTAMREDIAQTQEIHRGETGESPVESWTRIDALAVIAKWTGDDPAELAHLLVMVIVLAPAVVVLHRRRKQSIDDGVLGVTGSVIVLTGLVSLYKQSYDAAVLIAPLAGLAASWRLHADENATQWVRVPLAFRLLLGGALGAVLYSYYSTRMVLDRIDGGDWFERMMTSLSGTLLVACLLAVLSIAWRAGRGETSESTSSEAAFSESAAQSRPAT